MTKIEAGHTTVTLYPRNFQSELADLMERMLTEFRKEESGETPRRAGTKSKANALAREYDAKLSEGEAAAIKVDLREISNMEWQELTDDHPPREGNKRDERLGFNLKTFPNALMRASVVSTDLELETLGRVHGSKLEDAAWNLHNGDDALGKESMVSLLKQYREGGSKQQPDSE
jgi:hypothetical protein